MIIKKRKKTVYKETVISKNKTASDVKEEKTDLFDLDNINFSQRQERRRGDRRRGYRRIDDRNLISRAQEEAGTIRDSAAKEGYSAGIKKAQEDIELFKSSFNEFINAKQEIFEYIAPDILEISVDIARKIIKHEVMQKPEIILETILDVLNTISQEEAKVNIKVNPEQLSFVKENIPQLISSTGLEIKVHVLPDDTIEAGSCIFQTNNGIVDATVNTQLEIIKETFKGM